MDVRGSQALLWQKAQLVSVLKEHTVQFSSWWFGRLMWSWSSNRCEPPDHIAASISDQLLPHKPFKQFRCKKMLDEAAGMCKALQRRRLKVPLSRLLLWLLNSIQ